MAFTQASNCINIISEDGPCTLIQLHRPNFTFEIEVWPRVKYFHFYFWKKVFEQHEKYYGPLKSGSYEQDIKFDGTSYSFRVTNYKCTNVVYYVLL